MITTIRTATVAAGLVLAAGTAFAADVYTPPPEPIPVVPTIEWTGFYTGLNAGWGWGDGDGSTSYTPNPAAFGAAPFSSSMSLDGFVGGAQAGYNWQWDSFVGGVEADIQYSDMNGSHRVAPLRVFGGGNIPGSFQTGSGDIDWLATVRLRGGFLVSPAFLLYATGGFAFGDVSYSTFTRFAGAPTLRYAGSGSDTATGWTVGGGAEWKFSPNWSAKLEYLYFDLGNTDYVVSSRTPAPPFRVTQDFDTTGSIVRVGVNYHFSSY